MKCLIIAAGKGSRLYRKGNCKPLVSILGVPLIERVTRCAIQGEKMIFMWSAATRGTGCVIFRLGRVIGAKGPGLIILRSLPIYDCELSKSSVIYHSVRSHKMAL